MAWQQLMDQLMRERAPRLLGYGVVLTGSPADAEDLLHDAILKSFSRNRRFDHLNQAESYVRSTMRTLLIDGHRSRLSRSRAHERSLDSHPPSPDLDLGVDVRTALQQLAPRERVCVVMRYYDDLTVPQIAQQLGLADGTVKRYLHRARAVLADVLDVEIPSEAPTTVPVTVAPKENRS